MRTLAITKITKKPYKGYVYNLELHSNDNQNDDLYWIEGTTGIVVHNCFPKDINALIATMKKECLSPDLLEVVWEKNKKLRKGREWLSNPSAVRNPSND